MRALRKVPEKGVEPSRPSGQQLLIAASCLEDMWIRLTLQMTTVGSQAVRRGKIRWGVNDMPTMRELSRWIRDYGREPRHLPRLMSDRFVWHQLWAAMDIIDDVESAVTAYLENEFPTDVGEKYLRIYGALQGLFLQQDAVLDLF